ncbi:MAG: flavodoxin domain-containing protein [Alphaproteobacteria bacterium]|nr:flavodoxin domain-containing protein [Alphaproteobacteria bacterium]
MLTEQQKAQWEILRKSLSREQAIWFAGYVQGVTHPQGADDSAAQQKLRVYFATETGNSKSVAQQIAKQAKALGWNATPQPVKKIKKAEDLQGDEPIIFVTATHGEGDPPETALAFFEMLKQSEVSLKDTQYAVLGLGDSSYPEYNKAARDLDEYLQRMGAKSLYKRGELDVDFASHFPQWVAGALEALPSAQPVTTAPMLLDDIAPTGKGYSRLEPVVGRVVEIINLNDQGSAKETYHIEIEYDESLIYAPGDAAGIILPHFDDGVDHLTPRLYSIASSPSAHGNSVHLTVALAWHKTESGDMGFGLCSRYLADLKQGAEIRFFIQRNSLFKLPEDDRDIIMIGPGTGIAPFRGFVWERTERGASGRNWLFFGEQHQHCDFLYQSEWIDLIETEALHKIDLAFSRDQEHKIYVQHRLKERAKELLEWIEGGASIYVCGAKEPMSKDVEQALLDILAAHKGGYDAAQEFLDDLHDNNRYVKDVY